MALGCFSIITALYYENTTNDGNPIHLLVGFYLGITLIFGALVLAIAKK
jgi:hypothetical protein